MASGRPDRFTQMSEQAAIIARKKAEIEAKLKGTLEPSKKQDGGEPHSSSSSLGSSQPKASPGLKTFKNRWGFKGKRSNPEEVETARNESLATSPPSTATPSSVAGPSKPSVPNTFVNDGSFLEQFKKMKKSQDETKPPAPKMFNPADKDALKDEKPPEADDWYKTALAKARQIAQTMKQPPPSQGSELKREVKTESDEYGSTSKDPTTPTKNADVKDEYSPSKPTPITPAKSSKVSLENPQQKVEDDDDLLDIKLSTVANELASMVAVSGDQVELIAKAHNVGEEQLSFLYDMESEMYRQYRRKVESLRKGVIAESASRREDAKAMAEDEAKPGASRRKSRWGDESDKVEMAGPSLVNVQGLTSVTSVRRNNPQLIQYAIRVFGTTDLEESQWKQCEDQIKMTMVYNDILAKKKQNEVLEMKGHNKYEYDSDEDTEGGTWEHKARKLEMEKTQEKAQELTSAGRGHHHIGDFLPPDELVKFMAKYEAIKTGKVYVDESDYSESKLTEENLGFKMLQRMGWSEGKGLGSEGQGITTPVGQGQQGADKSGLGTSTPHDLQQEDDEFEAYRKRMMLAYRFRPNPMNNPRRAYY